MRSTRDGHYTAPSHRYQGSVQRHTLPDTPVSRPGPAGPPPSRGRIVAFSVGAVLLFAAGIGVQAIVTGVVGEMAGTIVSLIGVALGADAFRGARNRKLLAS